jgi:hypothetical protein
MRFKKVTFLSESKKMLILDTSFTSFSSAFLFPKGENSLISFPVSLLKNKKVLNISPFSLNFLFDDPFYNLMQTKMLE